MHQVNLLWMKRSVIYEVNWYKYMISYLFSERNWKIYLMISWSFSEMWSSFQNELTQIQCKSLHSIVCPKILFRGVQDCSFFDTVQWCNNVVQAAGRIFIKKIELDSWRSKLFQENRETPVTRWPPRFLKIINSNPSIMATKNKIKNAKLYTCTFQNIPQ